MQPRIGSCSCRLLPSIKFDVTSVACRVRSSCGRGTCLHGRGFANVQQRARSFSTAMAGALLLFFSKPLLLLHRLCFRTSKSMLRSCCCTRESTAVAQVSAALFGCMPTKPVGRALYWSRLSMPFSSVERLAELKNSTSVVSEWLFL